MCRVIVSNLGLTNPFAPDAGAEERPRFTGCFLLTSRTMCTTILFLSTLALVLRQRLSSRDNKTFPKDLKENEPPCVERSNAAEK